MSAPAAVFRRRRRPAGWRWLPRLLILAMASGPGPIGMAGDAPSAPAFYSTAAPPRDFLGPIPVQLAMADASERTPAPEAEPPAAEPPTSAPPAGPPARAVTRLASSTEGAARPAAEPELAPKVKPPVPEDPTVQAKRAIAEARRRFAAVRDYSCTFFKRERIGGRMTPQYVMTMKARTRPFSIYFKFLEPNAGREAIFVHGRNADRIMVHDVGIGKLLAGTLDLDPRGDRAMEDNRHPITEAGLGHLIETVYQRWNAEMKPGETKVTIAHGATIGNRRCTMIESMHPRRHPSYMFHKVKLYIDQEHGLPIRFEAYDWPRRAGQPAELVEEYTYHNLRINPGLSERDFDPGNAQYSFGRF